MSRTQQIVDNIKREQGNGLNVGGAEALRWAVWLCWEEFGDKFETDRVPTSMTSSEFADAAATLGVKRGTAMNRYSEARRNWIGSFPEE